MRFARLQDLREDADLRQEDVAKVLGITRQQYQLYESGKREIKFSMVIELARYYKVSIDYIAGLTNDPFFVAGRGSEGAKQKQTG